MKTIIRVAAVAACFLVSACADFKLTGFAVETPYGTINTDKNGNTTVILNPIVVEGHSGK